MVEPPHPWAGDGPPAHTLVNVAKGASVAAVMVAGLSPTAPG